MTTTDTNLFQLYLDEIGDPDLDSPKPFILSGCSIDEYWREATRNYADHIKFKYFGRTDIVFHSKEIGYAENEFAILNDPKIRKDFENDLLNFLREAHYKLFFVVLDKQKAKQEGWTYEHALHKTTGAMFRNFILSLVVSESVGNILIEPSDFERDGVFLKAFNYFRGPKSGLQDEFGIDYKQAQSTLTSLSFVTKKNFDIEVQIADLMAYAAWQKVKPFKQRKRPDYEREIEKILELKLFKLRKRQKGRYAKIYRTINPLLVVPEQLTATQINSTNPAPASTK